MTDETNAGTEVSGEDTAAVLSHAAGGEKTYLPEGGDDASQDDQTPGDDAAAAAEEPEAGEQPKPKGKSAQDRIDELTRDKHAERRAREALEREVAELRQAQPKTETPKAEAEPNPEDFQYGETDPGFIRALARFEAKQAFRAEAEQHQRRTHAQSIEQTWEQRQADFAKETPDYHEVLDRDWVCTPVMADAIRTSDDGARVAYHLAQHPDEARRIAGMEAIAQVRALGRLEATLAKPAEAPAPQPKTVSDAPAPHPTARGAGGQFKPAADTNDFAAFERAYVKGD
jgi:hypothetical protein